MMLAPALLLMGACGTGEANDQPEDAPERAVPTVPSGTAITVELDETVSTKSNEAGDPVTATVVDGVQGQDGTVIVPAGARLEGVVEQSTRSGGPEDQAVLAFQFQTLRVDGESYPVKAVVESAEPQRTQGDSGAESAAKVAIGAAAGAVLGQVLGGDTESTLKGAAAGTVAGAVVAITSRQGDATLPQGSLITVRTQEPVRLD